MATPTSVRCSSLSGVEPTLANASSASAVTISSWLNAVSATPDDFLSFVTRWRASTSCSSAHAVPARLALQDGPRRHGSDRCHRVDRQQRAGAAEAVPSAAGKPPRAGLRFGYSGFCTASFSGRRGRTRAGSSRACVAVDPFGHLQCEFEVGVSPKISRAGRYKKTVTKVKRTPVRSSSTHP